MNLLKAVSSSDLQILVEKLFKDVMADQKTDIYIRPKALTYMYKTHNTICAQPMVIDYIEAKSNIYVEYVETMERRMIEYPNLSYNFITKNSWLEMSMFLKKFPFFQGKVNVIKYSKDVRFIMDRIKQYPYTLITNQTNKVVYEGGLEPNNYKRDLIYLDLICQKISQYYKKLKIIEEHKINLRPNELGTLLGGLYNKNQSNIYKLPQNSQGFFSEQCYLKQTYKQPSRSASASLERNCIELDISKQLLKHETEVQQLAPPKFVKNYLHRVAFEEYRKGNMFVANFDEVM